MATYDFIVELDDGIVPVVKEAQYQLCLGVYIEGYEEIFPLTSVTHISCQYTLDVMSLIYFWNIHHKLIMHALVDDDNKYDDNTYRDTWLGSGNHDYYMTATKVPPKDRGMSATLLLDVKATVLSFLLISHV
jgi:hypothetical protein